MTLWIFVVAGLLLVAIAAPLAIARYGSTRTHPAARDHSGRASGRSSERANQRPSERTANDANERPNEAKQWGVRVAAPSRERACPQVQRILGKEFQLAEKPLLPLPDCANAGQCGCHYVKLFDRRKGERRSGQERRSAQRFETENPPRRSGKDRRKGKRDDIDWV